MARGTRNSRSRRRRSASGRRRMRDSPPSAEPAAPASPEAPRRSWPRPSVADALAAIAAIAGPLALYVATMPHTVALEDDGWFLIVGWFLGIGHPPGYPLHTLISSLFLKLPWGSPALLGHLLSAVLGALACGAVYGCTRLLGVSALIALIGAWLFAVSEHFWAQAIITEVYTLNVLCLFGIFALLLYLRRHGDDRRAWVAAAFLYGVSLGNHWPLMVLASPGLLLAALPMWREFTRRLPLLAGTFLLGVVPPYAWMVGRWLQEPAFSFPGTLRSPDDVVAHITRRAYSEVDTSVSAGWSDKLEFLQWLGTDFVWQLTLPGFLLALVGLAALIRRPPRTGPTSVQGDSALDWAGRWAGPAIFVGQSVLLLWLLNFDFDFFHVQVFRAYPLVCYGLLAIWAAMGLQRAVTWAEHRVPWSAFRRPRLLLGLAGVAGLAMVGCSTTAHWEANNRADSNFAQHYVDMVFEVLPPDAVILTTGDEITLPLGYSHFVAGRRPDVRLVEMHGIAFPSNLYPTLAQTTQAMQQQALREFIAETDRPVFHTYRTHAVDHGKTVRDYGFLREVLIGGEAGTIQLRTSDAAEAYFASLFEREFSNGWERVARNHQVNDYGQYLGYVVLSGIPDLIERTAPMRELAERDYYALNGMASVLAKFGNAEQLEQAMRWLEMAEPLRDAALTKQAQAGLYNNMGTVRWRQGDGDAAIEFYRKSREIMPHPDNPAVQHLEQIGR